MADKLLMSKLTGFKERRDLKQYQNQPQNHCTLGNWFLTYCRETAAEGHHQDVLSISNFKRGFFSIHETFADFPEIKEVFFKPQPALTASCTYPIRGFTRLYYWKDDL